MIENFIEYMWYLLTTPLKKLKKALNKWYILCKVFGRRFDEIKEDILRARDEGMVATCSHEMLPVHASDRGLSRYKSEEWENFRSRIAMYEEICKLGGTNEGILLAIRTLGYRSTKIIRANELTGSQYETLENRWAEFYVIINMGVDEKYPIGFEILQKTVRKWKEVGAKDNYLFVLLVNDLIGSIDDCCRIILKSQGNNLISSKNRICVHLFTEMLSDTGLTIEIKNNHFYLDGAYKLDGSKVLNTYHIREEI